MNEQITISALYDLNETIAADIFKDCTYPWEVLAKLVILSKNWEDPAGG